MYTETITQRLGISAPAGPQTLTTTTTLTSGSIDLSWFHKAFFFFNTGVFGGTAPTLSAALTVQESADNSTWTTNATVSPAAYAPAGSSAAQNTVEIRADQLGLNKRYVRLQAVCTVGGTSPTIPVTLIAFGDEADHKPGSAKNDASVLAQTVVN
jgi:hypothetical protein